jgi:hypothetical protein
MRSFVSFNESTLCVSKGVQKKSDPEPSVLCTSADSLQRIVNRASPLCAVNVTSHLVTQTAGQHYTRECWDLTLLLQCPASPWSVRFWVSVGRATTKIALHYLTTSTRGGAVWAVWDYTESCLSVCLSVCPSTYRPLTVDTTGYKCRIQRSVVLGDLLRKAAKKYTWTHVKIFVIKLDPFR